MKITKEEILKRVSQQAIWERYFPWTVKLSKSYRNPTRNDRSPGCRFYSNRAGTLFFHDFSQGKMWDCFNWVEEKYSCSFFEALKIINQDFGLGLGYATTTLAVTPITTFSSNTQKVKLKEKERHWEITQADFTEEDLDYWRSFGVTENTLSFYHVFKADSVYYNKEFYCQSEEGDPVFVYHFINWDRIKLYRPLTKIKKKKWGGYATKEVLQGYEQLPETGDLLIITKSLKDVMLLHELGYNAIAPTGETTLISEEQMEELQGRFTKIILLFDNDGNFNRKNGKGKYATKLYYDKYQLPYMFVPEAEAKDISDFYRDYNRDETAITLTKMIENAETRPTWDVGGVSETKR